MKTTTLSLLFTFLSLSAFANSGMVLSCQSQAEGNYSVTVLAEEGQTPSLTVARDGDIVFKEYVALEGVEAESSGALGKQSYLRVDYEDDSSGTLIFCENGKSVEVAFDYKECGQASAKWPTVQSSAYIPEFDCK